MSDAGKLDPNLFRAVIATGTWQLVAGWLVFAIAFMALLAGAAPFAAGGFAIAAPLLFWNVIIRMFHVIEAKLVLLITNPLYRAGEAQVLASVPVVENPVSIEEAKAEAVLNGRYSKAGMIIVGLLMLAYLGLWLKQPAREQPKFDFSNSSAKSADSPAPLTQAE